MQSQRSKLFDNMIETNGQNEFLWQLLLACKIEIRDGMKPGALHKESSHGSIIKMCSSK